MVRSQFDREHISISEKWQGWATTILFVLLIFATIFIPSSYAWAIRAGLATVFIIFAMLTFE